MGCTASVAGNASNFLRRNRPGILPRAAENDGCRKLDRGPGHTMVTVGVTMTFFVELVVTTCLLAQPGDCTEVRTHTDFSSAAQCERSALLLVAGMMVDQPARKATRYPCEERPVEHDIYPPRQGGEIARRKRMRREGQPRIQSANHLLTSL